MTLTTCCSELSKRAASSSWSRALILRNRGRRSKWREIIVGDASWSICHVLRYVLQRLPWRSGIANNEYLKLVYAMQQSVSTPAPPLFSTIIRTAHPLSSANSRPLLLKPKPRGRPPPLGRSDLTMTDCITVLKKPRSSISKRS